MKGSLRFMMVVILIIALIGIGAVLGALIPQEIMFFTTMTIVAIASMTLILIGYNGHKKEEDK